MLKKCSIGTARLPLLSHGYIPIRGLILIHKYLFPFLFPFLTIPLKASNSISGFSLMYFFIFPIHELLKMISAHPCLSSVPITCLPRKTIVGWGIRCSKEKLLSTTMCTLHTAMPECKAVDQLFRDFLCSILLLKLFFLQKFARNTSKPVYRYKYQLQ